IPKQNWVHVLALSAPETVLFTYDVPWLPEEIWHQAFLLRFLPSWTCWRRYHSWKRASLTLLWRVHHRLHVTCTAEESWTNYVILSRQGIVNLNAASSRQLNPHAVLNKYKAQNNLTRQPSTTRIILQLADVRIIAIGTLDAPTSFQVNRLAKEFIHPEGVYPRGITPLIHPQEEDETPLSATSERVSYSSTPRVIGTPITRRHRMFPNYTPGDHDLRWPTSYDGTVEECWIGPMLYDAGTDEILKRIGAGRSRWASFTIKDLDAIAQWLDNHIDKRPEGMGLGN
ncbi:hypothetical protein M408DRAFT_73505, partial [Serendipita vermifera MAFF 305830]